MPAAAPRKARRQIARFWPKTLVTFQVMLSLVLLVGAGLFLRTLRNLQNQDYGFERTHLLLADVRRHLAGYNPQPDSCASSASFSSASPRYPVFALPPFPPLRLSAAAHWTSNISHFRLHAGA